MYFSRFIDVEIEAQRSHVALEKPAQQWQSELSSFSWIGNPDPFLDVFVGNQHSGDSATDHVLDWVGAWAESSVQNLTLVFTHCAILDKSHDMSKPPFVFSTYKRKMIALSYSESVKVSIQHIDQDKGRWRVILKGQMKDNLQKDYVVGETWRLYETTSQVLNNCQLLTLFLLLFPLIFIFHLQ